MLAGRVEGEVGRAGAQGAWVAGREGSEGVPACIACHSGPSTGCCCTYLCTSDSHNDEKRYNGYLAAMDGLRISVMTRVTCTL